MTCEDLGASCGMPDDGCGEPLECGSCGGTSVCAAGVCECAPDTAEPNDTRTVAYALGTYDDSADTFMNFTAFAIHASDDDDWYAADVVDGFDGGNPVFRVEVDGIPTGHDYDLAVYFACASGTESVTCNLGTPDAMIGGGCTSTASGAGIEITELAIDCTDIVSTDDSGTAFIHVIPRAVTSSCAPYTLEVSVR